MECVNPITIKHPQTRTGFVGQSVPCGECVPCMNRRRSEWSFRLATEIRPSKTAWFVTFTYRTEELPCIKDGNIIRLKTLLEDHSLEETEKYLTTIWKRDLQNFFKRLRTYHDRKLTTLKDWPGIRYFACGEYGENATLRPHYHAVIFNVHPQVDSLKMEEIWTHGNIKMEPVTQARIHYVTGYILKNSQDYTGRVPKFALMSTRPPLGQVYIDKMTEYHQRTQTFQVKHPMDGLKMEMPRYFKRVMFTDAQKEKYNLKRTEILDENWKKDYEHHKSQGSNKFVVDNHRRELYREKQETKIKNRKL